MASEACDMRGYKFGSKLPNSLSVAVWQAKLAICRGYKMNLMQMSITAGILIIGIIAFRALFIHYVPKKVLVLLWEIAILRLALPFAVPLPFPVMGDLGGITMDSGRLKTISVAVGDIAPEMLGRKAAQGAGSAYVASTNVVEISPKVIISEESYFLWGIYGVAVFVMAFGSVYLYFRDSQFFREGLPMPEREKRLLLLRLEEKDRRRLERVKFCISDRTASPVTYGLFCQAIVFPKGLYQSTEKEVTFWLRHELVHIRHHDNLKKVIAHGVLCLHWFNPLVWLLYFLFNRDMELLCDEAVVRERKESRKDYALALLSMAQQKGMGFRTGLGFGKNAVTERITAVMKFKRRTVKGTLGAAAAVMAALTAFGSHYVSYAADGETAADYDAVKTAEYTVTLDARAIEDIAEADGPLVFGYTGSKSYETADRQTQSTQPGTAQVMEETAYWTAEAESIQAADATEYEQEATQAADAAEYAQGNVQTADSMQYAEEIEQAAEDVDYAVDIEKIIDEYRQFGLSIRTRGDDYQLYYENEPIYFFADNKAPEEEGFSGRLFLREAGLKNGKTGVIAQHDGDGKVSGLRHLSEEESKAYTSRWR